MKNRIERGTGLYAENLRTIAAREIEFRLTPYIFNLGIPPHVAGYNYLRDAVLSDARSAVWNSAKKGSLTPMEDWMKNFWNMNIFAKTGYLYGVFRLGETIMGYLNK